MDKIGNFGWKVRIDNVSEEWVEQHVVQKLIDSSDPDKVALGNRILSAKQNGLLTKTVTAIKKCVALMRGQSLR